MLSGLLGSVKRLLQPLPIDFILDPSILPNMVSELGLGRLPHGQSPAVHDPNTDGDCSLRLSLPEGIIDEIISWYQRIEISK